MLGSSRRDKADLRGGLASGPDDIGEQPPRLLLGRPRAAESDDLPVWHRNPSLGRFDRSRSSPGEGTCSSWVAVSERTSQPLSTDARPVVTSGPEPTAVKTVL